MPKLYSVAEANAALPTVVPLVEEIQNQARALASIEAELQEVRKTLQSNGHGRRAEDLTGQAAVAEHAVRKAIEALQAMDIELKDPFTGLIDFLHEREGRVVYLCWKLGEPRVAYWHDIEAGFAGRRALDPGE